MIDNSEESRAAWAMRAPWGVREIVQAAGILGAGLVFLGASVALIGAVTDLSLSDAQIVGIGLIATIFLEVGFFALAAGFSIGRFHLPWRALGFQSPYKDRIWALAAVVVASFVILMLYGIVIQLLSLEDELLPKSPLEDEILNNRVLTALAGVVAIIAAPVAEETLFRGFVFGGLVKRLGFVWAAVLSGFLFSLAHQQVGVIVPFTLIGVAFAWVYVYTGSLWSSISAHLLYNTISFVLTTGGWVE